MELTGVELELFELALMLKMPVYQLLDMPYDEFLGWAAYFKERPPGWREDYRAYMLMRAQGVKEPPGSLFSSLAPKVEKKSSFRNSSAFALMLKAKGGDTLEFQGE